MAAEPGIYVEILMRASVEEIWRTTQIPDLHRLWDLRFTGIDYLPKGAETEPQRFRYSTRIGLGFRIEGEGESTGTRADDVGRRTSALKFWSSDPKSLIEDGSGYWKYIPTACGVRFLTWYDYRTRFGTAGRWIDRLFFRPLIGWATAWSFDRLRLWLDEGVPPATSMRLASIHALARLGIGFIWLWQGLVPKLLFTSPDERAMLAAAGLPRTAVPAIGILEIAFAAVVVVFWRWRPAFLWNIAAMTAALIGVALQSPSYVAAAFNPVTLNAAVILLSLIGYLAATQLPSAARCVRRPPSEDS